MTCFPPCASTSSPKKTLSFHRLQQSLPEKSIAFRKAFIFFYAYQASNYIAAFHILCIHNVARACKWQQYPFAVEVL